MTTVLRSIVKSTPVPAAGVALGVVSLGGLHAQAFPAVQVLCVAIAALLALLVIAKIALFPASFRTDMDNPVIAGTFATLFMCLMQIASFLAPYVGAAAFALWTAAVICHFALMAWFTVRFVRGFELKKVFTSWFVAYVGIIVAALTAPTFGLTDLGWGIFCFGFACYAVLLVVVTLRHARHPLPDAAAPTFCIYTAPMSLSLAGYLAVAETPNALFVAVLAVLAQVFLAIVLVKMPRFLRLPFYPSYAAMTFPFVITATALTRALDCLAAAGWAVPEALHLLVAAEVALATVIVCYVLARYVHHIATTARTTRIEQRAAQTAETIAPANAR